MRIGGLIVHEVLYVDGERPECTVTDINGLECGVGAVVTEGLSDVHCGAHYEEAMQQEQADLENDDIRSGMRD